jgi:hypothetical protein
MPTKSFQFKLLDFAYIQYGNRKVVSRILLNRFMVVYNHLVVVHTGPKANTNKTQTQADLRGSPKPGTSTEAADCILMEE